MESSLLSEISHRDDGNGALFQHVTIRPIWSFLARPKRWRADAFERNRQCTNVFGAIARMTNTAACLH